MIPMKRCTRITAFLAALLAGSMYSTSCGDMAIQSLKTGVFAYVSGSVIDTFQTSQTSSFLNGLLTGAST
jgi:hypothetical protein